MAMFDSQPQRMPNPGMPSRMGFPGGMAAPGQARNPLVTALRGGALNRPRQMGGGMPMSPPTGMPQRPGAMGGGIMPPTNGGIMPPDMMRPPMGANMPMPPTGGNMPPVGMDQLPQNMGEQQMGQTLPMPPTGGNLPPDQLTPDQMPPGAGANTTGFARLMPTRRF